MPISRHIIAKIVEILCALLVAAVVGVGIYDLCSPWPTASQALDRFGRHYRFCIGMSSESSATGASGHTTFESSRQRVVGRDWSQFHKTRMDELRLTRRRLVFGVGLL